MSLFWRALIPSKFFADTFRSPRFTGITIGLWGFGVIHADRYPKIEYKGVKIVVRDTQDPDTITLINNAVRDATRRRPRGGDL